MSRQPEAGSPSLAARQANARGVLRRLRACTRQIERLRARGHAGPPPAPPRGELERRIHALASEAEQIRLEVANWVAAGTAAWAAQLDARVDRLASAIAADWDAEHPPAQRRRVDVWPVRAARRGPGTGDEVERAIYDYLYPRPAPVFG